MAARWQCPLSGCRVGRAPAFLSERLCGSNSVPAWRVDSRAVRASNAASKGAGMPVTPRPSSASKAEGPASASGLGPRRVAEFATRRPKRVRAVWGIVVLVSMGLVGTLLGSGLTSDSSLTNHPESDRAQQLIDQRLPGQDPVDEVIVVRSERLTVADAAFAARVRSLTRAIRANGGGAPTVPPLDSGGENLGLRGPPPPAPPGPPDRAGGAP